MSNNFFNRELSWLSFNYRVLQEAKDPAVPLYERIKFLAIYSSNLDEFFRVRVASLRSLLRLKRKTQKKLLFDPIELLKRIHKTVNKQQEEFGHIFREQIIPELEKQNILLVNEFTLMPEHKDYLEDLFFNELKPYLQPIILDKKIETFLQNKSIYFAVRLESVKTLINSDEVQEKKKRYKYAIVEIPSDKSGRFVVLPGKNDKKFIIFLDDVIKIHLQSLFPGYNVESVYSIKLTRDAELYIDDEFAGDLLDKIKKSLSKRKTGVPSRFLYDSEMPKNFLKYLRTALVLNKDDLIPGGRYHNFNDLFSFPNPTQNNLVYEPMPPLSCKELEKNESFFNSITNGDILLHYPYQKYDYVIKFLEEASEDENVTSIYITLYRIASDSQIVKALSKAAAKGKKVVAFVEVKARFDEESNFSSAEELQKAGVKVYYSFPGLKVHSKICLVSRKEDEKTYYAYLSTGNFNEKTSRIYSDFGLFTKDIRLTKEARKVFNILTKKSDEEKFNYLLVAPFNLRNKIYEMIDNEISIAQAGKKAYIILKLNSLEDRKMITKLYSASQAGVKIFIIVRGICCLIPGIKDLSHNIKVISIVDRYLEHTRVFIFCNGGEEKYFVSSADLMTRNLSRRIEVCFPLYNENVTKRVKKIIDIQLSDGVKSRIINKFQKNQYRKSKSNVRAQYETYEYIKSENQQI